MCVCVCVLWFHYIIRSLHYDISCYHIKLHSDVLVFRFLGNCLLICVHVGLFVAEDWCQHIILYKTVKIAVEGCKPKILVFSWLPCVLSQWSILATTFFFWLRDMPKKVCKSSILKLMLYNILLVKIWFVTNI